MPSREVATLSRVTSPAFLLFGAPRFRFRISVANNIINLEGCDVKRGTGGRIMSIQFQIEETPGYLAIRFTGSTTEAYGQLELIAERCGRASKNKLLLDFTNTHGGLSLAERYWLGDHAETFFSHKLMKDAVDVR